MSEARRGPWFKMFHEWASDPKVQQLSEVDQRRMIMLLCFRCRGDSPSIDSWAFSCRITPNKMRKTAERLQEIGFLTADLEIRAWESRQGRSEADRKRKQRSSSPNDVPGQSRDKCGTVPTMSRDTTGTVPTMSSSRSRSEVEVEAEVEAEFRFPSENERATACSQQPVQHENQEATPECADGSSEDTSDWLADVLGGSPPKKAKKDPDDIKKFIGAFGREYSEVNSGRKPTWTGQVCKRLKQLLAQHGLDEMLSRLAIFKEAHAREEFGADKFAAGPFMTHIDRWVPAQVAEEPEEDEKPPPGVMPDTTPAEEKAKILTREWEVIDRLAPTIREGMDMIELMHAKAALGRAYDFLRLWEVPREEILARMPAWRVLWGDLDALLKEQHDGPHCYYQVMTKSGKVRRFLGEEAIAMRAKFHEESIKAGKFVKLDV